MTTAHVILVQNAERDAALVRRRAPNTIDLRGRFSPAGARLMQRLQHVLARRGFRSRTSVPNVSVPGVDFQPGRSSSV